MIWISSPLNLETLGFNAIFTQPPSFNNINCKRKVKLKVIEYKNN